jgi:hydrogenase/urease accessory protein HupE
VVRGPEPTFGAPLRDPVRKQHLVGFGWALLALAACTFFPRTAAAHLLPPQNATIHAVGDKVYAVVSVPVSALSGVDDNGDGRLSAAELRRHQADISRQFMQRFELRMAKETGRVLTSWVLSPQTGGGPLEPMTYVVVLETIQFSRSVDALVLRTDLFGGGDQEATLSIRATRDQVHGAETELAVLDPLLRTHVFFRGPWSTFTQSVELGVEHILTGPDHLLFLLTILIGAAGLSYWLSVISSFTLSHSITLSLSAFGILHAPARLVEPAIAASIVLMALHQLLCPGILSRWRIAMVFACGLLHGMGLASALGELALDRGHRLGTLAGFNLGVELGQFIFLATVLALVALGRLLLRTNGVPLWPRLPAAAAAIFGTVMLVQRLADGGLLSTSHW